MNKMLAIAKPKMISLILPAHGVLKFLHGYLQSIIDKSREPAADGLQVDDDESKPVQAVIHYPSPSY